MLDLCLISDRWRNSVKDVESKPGLAIQSDHAMIVAKVKLKLKGDLKHTSEGIKHTSQAKRGTHRQLQLRNQYTYE